MTMSIRFDFDPKAWLEEVSGQFRNLDSKDPSSWPALPRYSVLVFLMVLCMAILWFVWLSDAEVELTTAQNAEYFD